MKTITIETIINNYTNALYRFAFSLTHNDDQAKELVQQTYIKAWLHQDQLRDDTACHAWLRKICLNEFRMSVRSTIQCESYEELCESGKQFEDLKIDALSEVVAKEEVLQLRNQCFLAMARKLTLQQRIAFSLVDMAGLSLQECAMVMDTSISAIKGLLVRARCNLQAFFEDHCVFINKENTCRCEAWMEFMKNREEFQKKVRTSFSALEYQKHEIIMNKAIQAKIIAHYQQIPYHIPDINWYQNIIDILKTS